MLLAEPPGNHAADSSTKVIAADAAMQELAREGRQASLAVLRQKGLSFFRYRTSLSKGPWPTFMENVPFLKLQEALDEVIARYLRGAVDEVELASTRYLTKVAQQVRVVRVLAVRVPLDRATRRLALQSGRAAGIRRFPGRNSSRWYHGGGGGGFLFRAGGDAG